MAGLVPATNVLFSFRRCDPAKKKAWVAGTSPAVTEEQDDVQTPHRWPARSYPFPRSIVGNPCATPPEVMSAEKIGTS